MVSTSRQGKLTVYADRFGAFRTAEVTLLILVIVGSNLSPEVCTIGTVKWEVPPGRLHTSSNDVDIQFSLISTIDSGFQLTASVTFGFTWLQLLFSICPSLTCYL